MVDDDADVLQETSLRKRTRNIELEEEPSAKRTRRIIRQDSHERSGSDLVTGPERREIIAEIG